MGGGGGRGEGERRKSEGGSGFEIGEKLRRMGNGSEVCEEKRNRSRNMGKLVKPDDAVAAAPKHVWGP